MTEFHPLKLYPEKTNEFALKAVGVPAVMDWFDIEPVPPLGSNLTVKIFGLQ
jgi:hypothetical protein